MFTCTRAFKARDLYLSQYEMRSTICALHPGTCMQLRSGTDRTATLVVQRTISGGYITRMRIVLYATYRAQHAPNHKTGDGRDRSAWAVSCMYVTLARAVARGQATCQIYGLAAHMPVAGCSVRLVARAATGTGGAYVSRPAASACTYAGHGQAHA
jgi:hypothetical protein